MGYFQRGAAIRGDLGDERGLGIILNNIGEMYALQGRWTDARAQFEQALTMARQTGFADFEPHILGMISTSHEEQGDYRSALDYYRQQAALSDSLYTADRSRQIIEMREQFDAERREQTIALQEAQIAEKSAALQRNYLILGFVILLLGGLTLLYGWQRARQELRIRQAQTAASIDSQERERKRIAQDLHDGLGQLIATARLAATGPAETTSAARTSKILDEMYLELHNIAFNLMPAALSKGGALQAITELAARLSAAGPLEVSVSATHATGPLGEARDVAIYRIVQEWLSNVIKHGRASRVEIQLVGHDDELVLLIEDNGPGFDPGHLVQGQGNGWMNIQARASRVDGLVHVDSRPGGSGSTFIVRMPIDHASAPASMAA